MKIMELCHGHTSDRISKLPDELLCHILSFVETKYSFRTSLLSRRWTKLWTFVPNFEFHHYQYGVENKYMEKLMKFCRFVDRVVRYSDVLCIQKFHLSLHSQSFCKSFVHSWICAVIKHDVKELDLDVDIGENVVLPRNLLSCQTLVALTLSGKYVVEVPQHICLPKLEIMHLSRSELLGKDSLRRLISSCPVLNDLELGGTCLIGAGTLDISAPALTRLMVDCSDASWLATYLGTKDIGGAFQESLIQLIRGASRVPFLGVHGHFALKAIGFHYQRLPTFTHLTCLRIGIVALPLLLHVLVNSPLLEVLHIAVRNGFIDPHKGCVKKRGVQQKHPQQEPSCVLFHLKTIEMDGFEGKTEWAIVEYFLNNAQVLENFTLDKSGVDFKQDRVISDKVSRLPNPISKACQITLLGECPLPFCDDDDDDEEEDEACSDEDDDEAYSSDDDDDDDDDEEAAYSSDDDDNDDDDDDDE